jgi:hypothetical protein
MSDAAEITGLVNASAFLLDEGDVEAVAALFEESTWRSDSREEVLYGSTEVRSVYEQLYASGRSARTKHLLTNLSVNVEPGATTASSRCYWSVLRADSEKGLTITLSGQYLDQFEKSDGRWHFADRLIKVDLADESGPGG